ncbi:MAG TPA: hypothetical protein VG168_14725 [Bryobacteraceae bacterium]|nr:hypothetical protein [Bryobacteraceae bacterium]
MRFRVADMFFPEEPLNFDESLEIEGVVVQFSDSGQIPRAFASVEILIRQTVVVQVDKLHVLPPSPPQMQN